MNDAKLPKTDSIRELADFWDSHEVTDFEEALEEVTEPIFARGVTINLPLESREVQAVEQMAHAKEVSREELVSAWVPAKTRPSEQRPNYETAKAIVAVIDTFGIFRLVLCRIISPCSS